MINVRNLTACPLCGSELVWHGVYSQLKVCSGIEDTIDRTPELLPHFYSSFTKIDHNAIDHSYSVIEFDSYSLGVDNNYVWINNPGDQIIIPSSDFEFSNFNTLEKIEEFVKNYQILT